MQSKVRKSLAAVLAFQRRRASLEEQNGERARMAGQKLEFHIEQLWRQMAHLQTIGRPNLKADPDHAGYVNVPLGGESGDVLCVPFHLIPATPELPILKEVAELAARVCLGEVSGRKAVICLSGSTMMLSDILKVGDIDFCEYVPADVSPAELAEAFSSQVTLGDARYCAASIRAIAPGGRTDDLQVIEVTHRSSFTGKQLEAVCQFVVKARNGKTAHVMKTRFAGVTEVTNWLIIFQAPLENDPVSRLSFAHQEAPLGIFGRRPLHTLEALAAYLNYLRFEIEKNVARNPVKALKRAISWLRLFSDDDLRSELLEKAQLHRAPECASALAKIELFKKYREMRDLKPDLEKLLVLLQNEIEDAGRSLFGKIEGLESALEGAIEAFGEELVAMPTFGRELPLLQRILSLAETQNDR